MPPLTQGMLEERQECNFCTGSRYVDPVTKVVAFRGDWFCPKMGEDMIFVGFENVWCEKNQCWVCALPKIGGSEGSRGFMENSRPNSPHIQVVPEMAEGGKGPAVHEGIAGSQVANPQGNAAPPQSMRPQGAAAASWIMKKWISMKSGIGMEVKASGKEGGPPPALPMDAQKAVGANPTGMPFFCFSSHATWVWRCKSPLSMCPFSAWTKPPHNYGRGTPCGRFAFAKGGVHGLNCR